MEVVDRHSRNATFQGCFSFQNLFRAVNNSILFELFVMYAEASDISTSKRDHYLQELIPLLC